MDKHRAFFYRIFTTAGNQQKKEDFISQANDVTIKYLLNFGNFSVISNIGHTSANNVGNDL